MPIDMSRANHATDDATSDPPGPKVLSGWARELYVDGPLFRRKMQHYRPMICPFHRLLPHVPVGASILDVGSGSGLFLALLAKSGRRVHGVGFDVSSDAINLAVGMAERIANQAPDSSLQFAQLDVNAAWPAGPFDVVSIIDVMHHVPPVHQRALIATAAVHVAPGGTLLYKDMCRRPRWRAVANRAHDLALARQWIHYAPIDRVESWARDEGLELTCAETINLLWYGHELRVFQRR